MSNNILPRFMSNSCSSSLISSNKRLVLYSFSSYSFAFCVASSAISAILAFLQNASTCGNILNIGALLKNL